MFFHHFVSNVVLLVSNACNCFHLQCLFVVFVKFLFYCGQAVSVCPLFCFLVHQLLEALLDIGRAEVEQLQFVGQIR